MIIIWRVREEDGMNVEQTDFGDEDTLVPSETKECDSTQTVCDVAWEECQGEMTLRVTPRRVPSPSRS